MFAVLPDLDAALIDFLKGHTALTPYHGGRVGTTMSGALTQIRLANLGGPDTWPWESNAEFQVECWGGTQEQANDLARTVCAAIYDMRGPVTDGYVTVAKPSLRPLWQPDANGRARYLVQVQLEATTP
jgi:hypothetical protein